MSHRRVHSVGYLPDKESEIFKSRNSQWWKSSFLWKPPPRLLPPLPCSSKSLERIPHGFSYELQFSNGRKETGFQFSGQQKIQSHENSLHLKIPVPPYPFRPDSKKKAMIGDDPFLAAYRKCRKDVEKEEKSGRHFSFNCSCGVKENSVVRFVHVPVSDRGLFRESKVQEERGNKAYKKMMTEVDFSLL